MSDSTRRTLEIATARRRDLALIILDLVFKDGSGVDVLRELRAAGVATRVLIYTSHPADDPRLAAAELGAIRYVEKPCKGRPFLNEVDRALAGPGPTVPYGSLFRPLGDASSRTFKLGAPCVAVAGAPDLQVRGVAMVFTRTALRPESTRSGRS